MNLESLANEIFFDLFEFLPTAELLHTFYNLNLRFNTLISNFFQASRHIDCRSMSMNQLDYVCQQYYPSIAHRIISLCLSDDNESPQQINRFFSHGLKLEQFICLQSLSFYHFHSEESMKIIMIAWHYLPYLTHLKFSECYFCYRENDVLYMINNIWSLSKLTHCYLDITFRWVSSFITPTIISSTIKSLCIQGINCRLNNLNNLFQHTIQLRYFHANINSYDNDISLPLTTSLINSLKLRFISSFNSLPIIINLLQNMCNLYRLTIETLNIYIDGYQWEQIITNYLPKLKIFRLRMEFYFRDRINTKRYVDQLLKSFRTNFWLHKRHWFIRCHYHPKNSSNYVCLYTLPYTFTSFPRIEISECQSTYSDNNNNNKNWSYDHVYNLNYRVPITGDLSQCQFRFINIQHLSLSFDVNDQFWTIVPTFDRLTTLEVSLHSRNNNAQSQLQMILDRAPQLNSLKFSSWRTLELPIASIISASVRQIDFRGCERWFDDLDCLTLINSPLGIQCQILRINVKNRLNIIDLVNKMINLRSLNVQCEDDKWEEHLPTSKDEVVNWLQLCLPSIMITRHTRYVFEILLWIR